MTTLSFIRFHPLSSVGIAAPNVTRRILSNEESGTGVVGAGELFRRASVFFARPTMADVYRFFLLACGITWLLDAPLALAWAMHSEPPPCAMTMVGIGACGPTLAAFLIAARRGELRGVFGRWRTRPIWVVLGLIAPLAVQLPATCIEVALGGRPAHWFYPPVRVEQLAAMVMFSFREEFGWRGFAYPRLGARYGAVVGSLILGAVWGLWHLGMLFARPTGSPVRHDPG
jgi:membrane protease YdiL (CAAX protease family)